MSNPGKRRLREAREQQLLRRYRKNRQRNVLATPGAHQFVLILDHLKAGYNVAKIFRSAQAFGAAAVHLVDIGPFDPAPSKGAFRKVPARYFDQFEQSYQHLLDQEYQLFALHPGATQTLMDTPLPSRSGFIFGHEEWGLQLDLESYPAITPVSIPRFGDMESLNVSIAASIAMYEYVRQRHMAEDS